MAKPIKIEHEIVYEPIEYPPAEIAVVVKIVRELQNIFVSEAADSDLPVIA